MIEKKVMTYNPEDRKKPVKWDAKKYFWKKKMKKVLPSQEN